MAALVVIAAVPLLALAVVAGLRAPVRVLLAGYGMLLPFGSSIELPLPLPAPFNTASSLLGAVVIAGMLAHLALAPRSAPRLVPSVPVWMLFAALCGVSFAWSVDAATTADELVILVSLIALFALASLMPIDERDLRRFEEGAVIGGAIVGAYGVVLLATSSLQQTRRAVPRFATAGGVGEGTDPNITAATLILPLAVALGRARRAESRAARLAFWAAAALCGVGIVLTGSRGGILAALAVLVVLGATDRRRRSFAAVGVAIAVVGVLAIAVAPQDLRDRITRPGSSGRTNIWRAGLDACPTYCWVGSGYGTFPTVYRDTLRRSPGVTGIDLPFVAHSIWISVLVETGILGAALLVVALVLTARDLFLLPRDLRGPPLAVLVGMLVASTLLSTLGFKYFWLALTYAALAGMVRVPDPATVGSRARPVLRPVPA